MAQQDYCKIRGDGSEMPAPNPLRLVISNPSDERYEYEGFLKKVYTDPPEYDQETQYVDYIWVQDGKNAIQTWTVHDIPVDETEA